MGEDTSIVWRWLTDYFLGFWGLWYHTFPPQSNCTSFLYESSERGNSILAFTARFPGHTGGTQSERTSWFVSPWLTVCAQPLSFCKHHTDLPQLWATWLCGAHDEDGEPTEPKADVWKSGAEPRILRPPVRGDVDLEQRPRDVWSSQTCSFTS